MSLRRSPTLTPARLAANRANAQKSTGPRTARGKAWSRMNGVRTGRRSRAYREFFQALLDAPPYRINEVADMLAPEEAAHPLFASTLDQFREVEIAVALGMRRDRAMWRKNAKAKRTREA